MFTVDEARELLSKANIFFGCDEPDEDPKWAQTINLNDAFYWAMCDGEYVEDSELQRVAYLFWKYGDCGVNYWVIVEKRKLDRVEFEDVNRQVEFVKMEEDIRKEEPSSSKRAYLKRRYTIGTEEKTDRIVWRVFNPRRIKRWIKTLRMK